MKGWDSELLTSFEPVKADLSNLDRVTSGKPYRDRTHVSDEDVQRWAELTGQLRTTLYDQIAIYLARGFQNSELTFEFCDAVLNDINGLITSADEIRPDLFWQIYLAFDEGEYYHDHGRDLDPAETYTRPQLAKIISSLPS